MDAVDWDSGLCGCFSNPLSCLYGAFCHPCMMASNSAHLDGAPVTCCIAYCCCYPANPCKNRNQALATFGYREASCTTCCITYCCYCCSECQIYRETLKYQGAASQVLIRNNGINYKRLVNGIIPGITLEHAKPVRDSVKQMYAPGRVIMSE